MILSPLVRTRLRLVRFIFAGCTCMTSRACAGMTDCDNLEVLVKNKNING